MKNLLFWIAALGILAFGAWLRWDGIAEKVMHTDEAVQGTKAGVLIETGEYLYDPVEHHGPTLYYFARVPALFAGQDTLAAVTERTLRGVPWFFGAALLASTLLLWRRLGHGEVLVAMAFLAVSLGMVYYSRYFIQEMSLVLFAFLFFAGLYFYWLSRQLGWLLLAGAAAGLMHATKETWVLTLGSAGAAIVGVYLWERLGALRKEPSEKPFHHRVLADWRPFVNSKHIAGAVAAALLIAFLFFSSFGQNPRGLLDSVLTYFGYAEKAGGGGHEKPFGYYFDILFYHKKSGFVWGETFIFVFAALGMGRAVFARGLDPDKRVLLRGLSIYAVSLVLLYSTIPYKTPWLALNFVHPLALLAGAGVLAVFRLLPAPWPRAAFVGIVALLLGITYRVTDLGTSVFAADERNPYAYMHTSDAGIRDIAPKLRKIGELTDEGTDMRIEVMSFEYWPLPWYLRDFSQVGYWAEVQENPSAPVIITSVPQNEALQERISEDAYTFEVIGLRPGVMLLMYIRKDIWEQYIESISN